MSDSLFDSTLPEGQLSAEPASAAPTAWYRRRVVKVTATGVAAAAVVVGGFGVYASASTPPEPTAAIEQAFQNLGKGPVSVTVTSADKKDSSVTFTHMDAGTQVSVESPDGTFEAVLNSKQERLYLRVDTDEVTEVTKNPFFGMLSGFSSIDSLLNGMWVSVDVSEDSPVLTALAEAEPAAREADSKAVAQAQKELGAAVTAIVDDLKDPAIAAITENATVTRVDDAQAEGSEHYRVDVDVAAAQADIEDDLRGAVDDLLAALDDFSSTAGDAVPGVTEGLPELREELTTGLDEGLAEESATETVDIYLADEQLAKIVTDDLTLTFAADPALEDVTGAVSMDDDLVHLLPMMMGLMAIGDELA